jgi:hypothetical protein
MDWCNAIVPSRLYFSEMPYCGEPIERNGAKEYELRGGQRGEGRPRHLADDSAFACHIVDCRDNADMNVEICNSGKTPSAGSGKDFSDDGDTGNGIEVVSAECVAVESMSRVHI